MRALEAFRRLASAVVEYHPDSTPTRAAGRLAYLAAAIACESLDYVSVGAAFRSIEERRKLILDAVRLGALSDEQGQQTLKMALALVEKYAPGGKGAARGVEAALKEDLERIPAEIVADQAVKLLRGDQLFLTGRELEMAAYAVSAPAFDGLSVATKSMLGALLDFANVDRARFANAWKAGAVVPAEKPENSGSVAVPNAETSQGSLFSDK